MPKLVYRPEGGHTRNSASNTISEQYSLGRERSWKAPTVRRAPVASVTNPKPLKPHTRIVHEGCQGVVISTKDRYALGV